MRTYALIIGIVLLGAFLRFTNLNWDDNQHLHPDERFLTMVVQDTSVPASFGAYLDPAISPLNPLNTKHTFYVYGNLPVTAVKYLTHWTGYDGYNDITIIGRAISALLDSLIVVAVFLVSRILLRSSGIALWSAFFYATAVLPIQLAHFYAVDTVLAFFIWISILFALLGGWKDQPGYSILSGFAAGCAVASKITGLVAVPVAIFFLFVPSIREILKSQKNKKTRIYIFGLMALIVAVFFMSFYLAIRIGSPYYFASASILDFRIHPHFLSNLRELQGFSNPDALFPPAVQWLRKSAWFGFRNTFFFGLGVFSGSVAVLGFGLYIRDFWINRKKWHLFENVASATLILWMCGLFVYLSIQPVRAMRYLIYLYPVFVIVAGYGADRLYRGISIAGRKLRISSLIVIFFSLVWPAAFMSIYTKPHSRVAASRWIYSNIRPGSVLITESWDDGLPLPIPHDPRFFYQTQDIYPYDPEDSKKLEQMNSVLAAGDYYIVSSNRAWGSITSVPDKYPETAAFYQDLFAGRLGYKLVAEFTSYPSLRYLGIPIDFPDEWAEEAFTVYDHPRVMILKKIIND